MAVDKLNRVVADFQGSRPRFRIDISERRELLTRLYQDAPFELDKYAPISIRNMYRRSELIKELLDQHLDADNCQFFVDWLLTDVMMVGIRAGSKANGFKIFESMNDRGARLTAADLVKSFLMANL